MTIQEQTCIIGGGIAGMSAALSLASRKIQSTLLEKRPVLHEVGAGLHLSPNATFLLKKWGLLEDLTAYAVAPELISLKEGRSGKTLLNLPIKEKSQKCWGSPYLVVHRVDFQHILKAAIDKNPLIDFRPGWEIISCQFLSSDSFIAEFLHDRYIKTISGNTLISCDGVWSRIRESISEKAIFSGYIAWRTTVKKEELPDSFSEFFEKENICVWMGKDGHFVSYPLLRGQFFNFIAVTRGKNLRSIWSRMGEKQVLESFYETWHPAVFDIVHSISKWLLFPIFTMPHYRFLGDLGEIFVGDAAHALTPFSAQGAAMAIEDAETLAVWLSHASMGKAQALKFFEQERQKRLEEVAKRGELNRSVYHASGFASLVRNGVMKFLGGERILDHLDWLYGYEAGDFSQKP